MPADLHAPSASTRPRGWRRLALALLLLVTPWAVAALALDLRVVWQRILALAGYLLLVGFVLARPEDGPRRYLWWMLLNVLVLVWWLRLKPPLVEAWAPEFSRSPWSERVGDRVTIHEVRNFHYRTEHDFDQHWATRTVDLGAIEGADLFLTHWGAPAIAHAMISFRLATGGYLATSIEARRTTTQDFSALRGFFRQFQVSYLVADERDVVRVRTNYRVGEEVYLYRTRLTPADARALFEAYLGWMNANRVRPQWYNALTRNCSSQLTAFLADRGVGGISRWNWRGILDGSGDRMLYDLGDLADGGLPFPALKRQAHINAAAREADAAPDFSQRIRAGRAGFGP